MHLVKRFKLDGCSTPDITRGKGDDIHILINGKPVAAQPFLQSIRRGYKTRLMQRKASCCRFDARIAKGRS